jgi:glycosyltransferase involved in cell wall biosynthesis
VKDLKILILIYENGSKINGPIVNQERIIPCFKEEGMIVQCLCLYHHATPVADRLEHSGIPLRRLPAGKDTAVTVKWILTEAKDFSPDIFITDWIAPGWYASRWLRRSGVHCIGSVQSDDEYFWSLVRRFLGGTRKSSPISAVWCLSRRLASRVGEYASSYGGRIRFIPSGVPIEGQVKPEISSIKMVYVGRIEVRQKQIIQTVLAMCNAVKSLPDATAGLFGNGPDEDTVTQLIKKEGCSQRVTLYGAVTPFQIQDHLRDFNVMVLLSDYEGTPGALLDGMAMGLVPVCLHCPGGIEEVVVDGKTGILVSDRQEGFLAAIHQLAADNEMLQELSRNAQEHVRAEYTLSRTIDRWLDLFRDLMSDQLPKRQVRVPHKISLPPIDPDMAGFDFRMPTKWDTFIGQCKVRLGAIKRRVLMRN